MRQVQAQARGFTLIEVLLAIAITAFVALVAYYGLSTSIAAAESSEQQAQRLADIQLSMMMLERDIRNAAPRAVVDEYGDLQPLMSGGAASEYLLVLTRYGWDNPLQKPRGEIQRVRYVWQDDQLWRESWNVLDRVDEDAGLQRVMLIEGVESVQLRFLNPRANGAENSELGGEWQDEWELANNYLPRAVEITLELENFGQLKRLLEVVTPE